ncbi:hypothetical protein [Bowmanella sp. JS7-9]|uniref:Uncharacterized protein n=1 Tax=Pseudobowmanella zhangzhouensis TaxID=1537679 RepID=A0ABW1XMD5_9ALTE|nr:hypothetical protein [Bowmanella sp. JS7-9]TBX22582.1 hypothetical protein TK45_09090 [Bowmanella sp. JS7-9]
MLRKFVSLVVLTFFLSHSAFSQTLTANNVLILITGEPSMPWYTSIQKGISSRLAQLSQSGDQRIPNVYIEFLDLYHYPPQANDPRLGAIMTKYRDVPMDMILTEGITVAHLLQNNPDFYPRTAFDSRPVVINFNTLGVGRDNNVQIRLRFDLTAKLIKQLVPGVKRFVVVGNYDGDLNHIIINNVQEQLGLKAEFWEQFESVEQLVSALQALTVNDVVYYNPLRIANADGQLLIPYEVARLVAESSPAPVFSWSEILMGTGIVGGYLVSPEKIGARMVDTIFTPATYWPQHDFFTCTFDKQSLQRWNIDRNRLPLGSLLIKDEQTSDVFSWAALRKMLSFGNSRNELDNLCLARQISAG